MKQYEFSMNSSNALEAIKELFFDFIGYFFPGFVCIIILSVNTCIEFKSSLIQPGSNQWFFTIVIISYAIGYIIYGLGIFYDNKLVKFYNCKFLNWFGISHPKKLKEIIRKSPEFETCYNHMKSFLSNKETWEKYEGEDIVNKIRNIAMSFSPNSDKKIYTFMFRSDISHHLGIINFNLGLISLIIILIESIFDINLFFNNDIEVIILNIFLIFTGIFLSITRSRFYGISLKLPFSIYISEIIRWCVKKQA